MCGAPSRSVAIGGFMAVGKSTVAPLVARALGLPSVDLDAEVERRAGRPLAVVFRDDGEAVFREHELRALAAVLAGPPAVIALGGGTLHQPESLALLRRTCTVVVLWAPWVQIAPRIGAERPLAARAAALFAERAPGYAAAGLVVDVAGLDPAAAARAVLGALPAAETA